MSLCRPWMIVMARNAFAVSNSTKSVACLYDETCFLYHLKQTEVERQLFEDCVRGYPSAGGGPAHV